MLSWLSCFHVINVENLKTSTTLYPYPYTPNTLTT